MTNNKINRCNISFRFVAFVFSVFSLAFYFFASWLVFSCLFSLLLDIVRTQFNILPKLNALTCFGNLLSTKAETLSVATGGDTCLGTYPKLTSVYFNEVDTKASFSYTAMNGLVAMSRLKKGEIDLAYLATASMYQNTVTTSSTRNYLFLPTMVITISPLVILPPAINTTATTATNTSSLAAAFTAVTIAPYVNVILTPDIIAKIYIGNITR